MSRNLMKKRLATMAVLGGMMLAVTGCGHEHTWTEATCTAPKTCDSCGETEGDVLEHSWTEATCTAPKTCSVCGKTKLAHNNFFSKNKTSKDGFYSICKCCRNSKDKKSK